MHFNLFLLWYILDVLSWASNGLMAHVTLSIIKEGNFFLFAYHIEISPPPPSLKIHLVWLESSK
jgi:hypothetical protein